MPKRRREPLGLLIRLAGLCPLLAVGYYALAWHGPIGSLVIGWLPPIGAVLVSGVAAARLAFVTPLSTAAGRFWRRMTIAVGISGLGVLSEVYDTAIGPMAPTPVLSQRTMAFFLAAVALIMVALLLVPAGRMTRGAWITFALDAGTVLTGSALFTWYFLIRTAGEFLANTGSTLPVVAIIATAFLGVLVTLKISFAGVRQIDPGALKMLALCTLASVPTAAISPWLASRLYLNSAMLALPSACLFLTLGIERQRRVALAGGVGAARRPEPAPAPLHPARFRPLHLLPYVAVALTDGLLLRTMDGPHNYRLVAVGAVVLTALVVARQLVSFRENSRLLTQLDTTVAELRTSENRLIFQASHDLLTGLPNRALLADRTEAALADPAGPADVAMALIDLDDFKQVNDRLGHIVGDTLLVAAAARVRDALGPDDVVARLGGDEFAVLFRGIGGDLDIAASRIELVLAALARPLRLAGDELRIRASVGLADGWPGADSAELIRRADVAMYAAKGDHEGGWVRFAPALDAPAADQARLAHGLRDGLGQGDFRLVYQPIVALPEARIVGVEALIRWHDPERGIIPPDRFIPVAERSGLIVPLGRWVLREACRQAAQWRRECGAAAPDRVSVNVSPRQLDEPDFVNDVVTALADTGLPAASLVLEVTETAVFRGGPGAVEALNALRALGVRIALDDFGTGQSSLGLLLSCPVDILKVDKSFVDGVTESGDRAVIVEFLSQVARGLNLVTVAEGVETAAQARRLHELGYLTGQGYLFSRPLPPAELAHVLVVGAPGAGFVPAVRSALRPQPLSA